LSNKRNRAGRSAGEGTTPESLPEAASVEKPGLPISLKRYALAAVVAVVVVSAAYSWRLLSQGGAPLPGAGDAANQSSLYVSPRDAGYLPGDACKDCHADVYETYQHTGMGRSFYRLEPGNVVEDFTENTAFYHEASDRHYQMIQRNGRYYQRRYQIGFDGLETNAIEKEIDFVVGSGNHARTYLSQTVSGGLVELPLAWYSAEGGYWAMNPGYDRSDHDGFRRRVTYECLFCHNGYPEHLASSDLSGSDPVFPEVLPNGIDCQRCHGPGRDHIEAVQTGRDLAQVREAIVNPSTLDPARQMEVCLQCHLESTSSRLPNFLRRFDRGVFSHRPGEPLADSMLFFDYASGTGHDDTFDIAHQGYRLRKSACFLQSAGQLTCTTCHDPHDVLRGEAAKSHYIAVCQNCHEDSVETLVQAGVHTASGDCLTCHMPKRRTDDVVHAVMTDHYIQRRKPARDLLAPLNERPGEAYVGEVQLDYPPELPPTGINELYMAVAQVKHNSNLKNGIPRLKEALEKYEPERAEFYFELAKSYSESGRLEEAVPYYQQASQRDPNFWPALHRLGLTLARLGRLEQSADALERARKLAPAIATLSTDLGLTYLRQGRFEEAIGTFREATAADPDSSDAYNNLGGALIQRSDISGAEQAFREAIRHQPDSAAAHDNLATFLVVRQDFAQAEHHFRKSIEADARFAPARLDYGRALIQQDRYSDAFKQLTVALDLDPQSAQANTALGDVVMLQGETSRAVSYYRRAATLRPDHVEALVGLGIALIEQRKFVDARQSLESALAVKPDEMEAHFHLGRALALLGLREQANLHLRQAASSSTPAIRQAALEMIESLNRGTRPQ
jgi:predicted CXXCH cytochrome family protein